MAGVFALLILSSADPASAQSNRSARRPRPNDTGLRFSEILNQPSPWYAAEEARRIADNILAYQHPSGGWPKNVDMARRLTDDELDRIRADAPHSETLIDNGATYTQIRYLAKVHAAQPAEKYADAARRGVDYLLASQYDNGGFPMIFPLQHNYTAHITFNDGAMIGALRLLADVAAGRAPFDFIDADRRQRAQTAVDKGLGAILKCQIVVDGHPTAWCAQHDQLDLKPRAARTYELPSISGSESVGVVEYLMDVDPPTPEVRRAVEGAAAWFEAAKMEGLRVRWVRDPKLRPSFDLVVEEDPDAKPLWARFYEIGTNRPMFVGRDGVVHDRLADIEHERRTNYSYLGPSARRLLEKDYPAWKSKWGDD